MQKVEHRLHHIADPGLLCGAVVHEDTTGTRGTDHLCHAGVALRAPNVVDDIGTHGERGLGDLSLRSVDRDEGVRVRTNFLDERDHPGDFLRHRDGHMSGARGLAPDIDQVRTRAEHGMEVQGGRIMVDEVTAIGKGIGREV